MSYSEPAAREGVELFSADPELNRHPQEMYRALRAAAPVVSLEGMGHVLTTKEAAMEAFRRPDVFSSAATVDTLAMGSVRPLIPLQIDPPDHLKYRKILDPLFAPRQMAALEDAVAALVNDLIDGFVERGECDFAKEFSVPLPSQVFLTLLGLPLSDLELFLQMKDGIIRPDHVIGKPRATTRRRSRTRTGSGSRSTTTSTRVLDEREVERRDDLLSGFLDAEVDGAPPHPRGHPRHLLPLPHRRPRHRERVARLLLRLPVRAPGAAGRSSWPTRRSCRRRSRSCCGGRRPVGGIIRVAAEDTELARLPDQAGRHGEHQPRLGRHRRSRARPTPYDVRFDREVNPHNAFGGGVHRCLGSHLARLELRVALREWHRRIPEYAVQEGHELVYTPAIRSLDTFPMVFTSR